MALQPDIRIPVSKSSIALGLFPGQHKMWKAEHGRHILFIAEIMARNTEKISGRLLRIQKLRQNQMPVIIIAMKQETVVSVSPDFPRQKANVLRFDGQDFTAVVIVKRKDFGILITHFLPDIIVSQFLIFLPVQFGETGRVFRPPGLKFLLFGRMM